MSGKLQRLSGFDFQTALRACIRDVAAQRARVLHRLAPRNEGAGRPQERRSRPSKKRARGMPGARGTRSPCAAKSAHGSHYRYSGTPGISLRNGFTAYALLSPATNSFCHRRRRIWLVEPGWADVTSANLTPATGARTTRFCRTRSAFRQEASAGMCTSGRALAKTEAAPFVHARDHRSPALQPALQFARATTLPRPPHPAPDVS
jgi:hypothetical protein